MNKLKISDIELWYSYLFSSIFFTVQDIVANFVRIIEYKLMIGSCYSIEFYIFEVVLQAPGTFAIHPIVFSVIELYFFFEVHSSYHAFNCMLCF